MAGAAVSLLLVAVSLLFLGHLAHGELTREDLELHHYLMSCKVPGMPSFDIDDDRRHPKLYDQFVSKPEWDALCKSVSAAGKPYLAPIAEAFRVAAQKPDGEKDTTAGNPENLIDPQAHAGDFGFLREVARAGASALTPEGNPVEPADKQRIDQWLRQKYLELSQQGPAAVVNALLDPALDIGAYPGELGPPLVAQAGPAAPNGNAAALTFLQLSARVRARATTQTRLPWEKNLWPMGYWTYCINMPRPDANGDVPVLLRENGANTDVAGQVTDGKAHFEPTATMPKYKGQYYAIIANFAASARLLDPGGKVLTVSRVACSAPGLKLRIEYMQPYYLNTPGKKNGRPACFVGFNAGGVKPAPVIQTAPSRYKYFKVVEKAYQTTHPGVALPAQSAGCWLPYDAHKATILHESLHSLGAEHSQQGADFTTKYGEVTNPAANSMKPCPACTLAGPVDFSSLMFYPKNNGVEGLIKTWTWPNVAATKTLPPAAPPVVGTLTLDADLAQAQRTLDQLTAEIKNPATAPARPVYDDLLGGYHVSWTKAKDTLTKYDREALATIYSFTSTSPKPAGAKARQAAVTKSRTALQKALKAAGGPAVVQPPVTASTPTTPAVCDNPTGAGGRKVSPLDRPVYTKLCTDSLKPSNKQYFAEFQTATTAGCDCTWVCKLDGSIKVLPLAKPKEKATALAQCLDTCTGPISSPGTGGTPVMGPNKLGEYDDRSCTGMTKGARKPDKTCNCVAYTFPWQTYYVPAGTMSDANKRRLLEFIKALQQPTAVTPGQIEQFDVVQNLVTVTVVAPPAKAPTGLKWTGKQAVALQRAVTTACRQVSDASKKLELINRIQALGQIYTPKSPLKPSKAQDAAATWFTKIGTDCAA